MNVPHDADEHPGTLPGTDGMRAAATHTARDTVTASATLTLMGRKVRLDIEVSTGPVEPVELLPLFQSLADVFVRIGTEQATGRGGAISCGKGCGACCRQLVPISATEAEAIGMLVEMLPEPRRTDIRDRFAAAVIKLTGARLIDTLRAPESLDAPARQSLGLAYLAQGIACPFLEKESCSIHAERPLACREYLVTSPAAHCATPREDTVRLVPLPGSVAGAVRAIEASPAAPGRFVPMILALEHASVPAERRPGPTLVAALFENLTGRCIAEP